MKKIGINFLRQHIVGLTLYFRFFNPKSQTFTTVIISALASTHTNWAPASYKGYHSDAGKIWRRANHHSGFPVIYNEGEESKSFWEGKIINNTKTKKKKNEDNVLKISPIYFHPSVMWLYSLMFWDHLYPMGWKREKRSRGSSKTSISGASLVARWLRIRLPMQGIRVRALVQEDPTCHGATKPLRHNYQACTLEPVCHNYWAYVSQLLKPARLEPMLRNKRSHHKEKPAHHNKE